MNSSTRRKQTVGVISDTHGLLRPEVSGVFKGVDLILHAGDIGSPDVLESLRSLAPVIAVRGNNDKAAWARRIPELDVVEVGRVRIYLLHDVKEMNPKAVDGFSVVISGHSHRPLVERRDSILFVNPGSAGPRRFSLPVTVARLFVDGKDVEAEIIELEKKGLPSFQRRGGCAKNKKSRSLLSWRRRGGKTIRLPPRPRLNKDAFGDILV
jgi:uncharacterized protein